MAAVGTGSKSIGSSGKKAEGLATDISSKYGKDKHPEAEAKKNPGALREQLKKKEGMGKAPDSAMREKLSGPLGADPAAARFHTGPAAADAAQQLQASAFTIGHDVFFGANKYDPTTHKGIGLIAHEATHVVQQTGAKGVDARFFSQRGGDDMEQEAQDAAELVLTNLGVGEALHVGEYVRNYIEEGGESVSPQDRARLDAISMLALKKAQVELRKKGVKDVPVTKKLVIDLALDLAEMSDQEAAQVWSEAIVEGVTALRIPVGAPRPSVQRDPAPAPATPAPPAGPDNPETLQVKIVDPSSGLNAAFTMRHFTGVMEFDLHAIGVAQVRLLVRILQGAQSIQDSGEDSDHYGSHDIWLNASPYTDTAARFYRILPKFKQVAAKMETERTEFIKDFLDRGSKAMLALITESRARVVETQKKYGIVSHTGTESSNQPTTYSSNNDSLNELVTVAKKLLPKRQHLEHLMESQENLASKLHIAFTSASQLSREEEDVKALPAAQKEWEKDFGEALNKYPIISHYETASGLDTLANGQSIGSTIGLQLATMLTNLKELEDKINADKATMYKLGQGFEAVKKSVKPELTDLQLAYVNMQAEDIAKADENLKMYLTLFSVVVGIMSGGLGGFALLAAEGVVAGISTYQLIQEIEDYQLQDAAHMTDPELAKALSAADPSLFWLVFDIVSTVVGIRANIGKMRQAVDEIRNAYNLAVAYGDAAQLEKALAAHNVPAETSRNIVNTAFHATTTIANFIRDPNPLTAFGVINLAGSFYNLRTAVFKSKEPPEVISKAKATFEEARIKATQAAIDRTEAKYHLVKIEFSHQGFEQPHRLVVGSSEIPMSKMGAPPSGSQPGKTTPGMNTIPGGHDAPNVPPSTMPPGKTTPGMNTIPGGHDAPHVPPTSTGPKGPPVPEGVYAIGDTAPAVDPALAKTAPPSDPALAKTPQAPPPTDPALAKTPVAPPSDPALAKTPQAPQLHAAVDELKNGVGSDGGADLAHVLDWDILDKSAAYDTLDGSKASPAPMGEMPADADFLQKLIAAKSKGKAAAKGIEGYYGTWVRLPADRFVAEAGPAAGSSYKYILKDTKTGRRYLFKPAVGEPPLQEAGHKAHGNTLFVRAAVSSEIAKKMPSVGQEFPAVVVAVHDGRVGSLQPFVEGTKSLRDYMGATGSDEMKYAQERALYTKLMKENPGFEKFRNNLRAYDHIINNTDREANFDNILIEVDKDNNLTKFYAIDQDAAISPGMRNMRDSPLLPRSDLNSSWTDPGNPVMGKISKSLYNEMCALVANETTMRANWKGGFAITDEALNGVFGRMKQVVRDYSDRLKKAPESEVFFVD